MDEFLEWLKKNKEHYALVDKSYKTVRQGEEKKPNANDIKVNTELATYGDAVLKLALCKILWSDDASKITEKKKKYEKDQTLVEIIAKRYKMLNFIKYDKTNKPSDYNYNNSDTKSNGRNTHKFIATAVEACLGAIFIEEGFDKALRIVEVWKGVIDQSYSE